MIYKLNGVSATRIRWNPPTTRTDGTGYGESAHAGYELGLSDPAELGGGFAPHVSVPAAYNVTEWPLDELNLVEAGVYELALRTVDRTGLASPWSNSVIISVELAPPNAPTGFSVF